MEKLAERRRERKDTLRNLERVLEAANELFAERGSGVTMEEVARRAGVGVGTVYRRFPSKEHLFAAVSHAACDDTRHTLKRAIALAPDMPAKLRALAHTMYRRCQLQAALLDPMLAASPSCAAAAEQHELYGEVAHMVALIIAEGQRQGVFAAGNVIIRAALCTELLTPRVFHQLMRSTGGDADTVADHVVDFMLKGLTGPLA